MNKKHVSIDLISFFTKFIFLFLIGFFLVIGIFNIIELFKIILSSTERRLCIYKGILEENNIVSTFLMTHSYNVLGTKGITFLDGSFNILSITLFLRIFEILKYIFLAILSLFIYKLLNNYSKNKVDDKESNKYLLIVSILFTSIPFIYFLRDLFGCLIINSYPIEEKVIDFSTFKLPYLFIGLSLLGTYLFKVSKNEKNYLLFKKISSIILGLISIYLLVINISSIFSTLKLEKQSLEYYELTKLNHPFIGVLADNSFEIFGSNWTHLYKAKLQTPMILYYSFNSIIYLLFTSICIYDLFNIFKKQNNIKNIIRKELFVTVTFILSLILNIIFILVVIDKYNNYEYYNTNLSYNVFNLNYLYSIIPMILVLITTLLYQKDEKMD